MELRSRESIDTILVHIHILGKFFRLILEKDEIKYIFLEGPNGQLASGISKYSTRKLIMLEKITLQNVAVFPSNV